MHDLLDTDHYDVLGVSPDADQREIARAYRRLARDTHPDARPDDADAAERFTAIARAYEVLGDPDARSAYDHERSLGSSGPLGFDPTRGHHGSSGYFTTIDGDDLLADLLGASQRFPRRGADVIAAVDLDVIDVVDDRAIRLTMADGTTRSVTVPAGVADGETVRMQGAGLAGSEGGPPGDLLLEVSVRDRDPFRRDGDHIVVDVAIGFVTAALGGTAKVPTPRGRDVTVRVPPASSDGRRLRIGGAGIDGGDLHARLRIQVPDELDDDLATTLESLRDRLDP